MPSGYSSATATDIIPNGALIYVGSVLYGTTRGPGRADPGETWRNPPFDGKVADIATLDRLVFRAPTITVTLLELTATKIAALMPGSTSGTVGTVTTITPANAQVFLTPLSNVRAIWRRADLVYVAFRLYRAMPQITGIGGGAADDEATAEVTFMGRAIPTSDTTHHAPLHAWELSSVLADILALT